MNIQALGLLYFVSSPCLARPLDLTDLLFEGLTVDYSVMGYFFSFIYLQLIGCRLWVKHSYAPH